MKYKIVSLLLVFVLLFMFTFQPIHKSQAVAIPLATHFGGYAAAQAFLGWLLLMQKLGVVFNDIEEAKVIYVDFQNKQIQPPLDPQPPEGQTPQRDWLRWLFGIATGATLLDSIGDLFGDVKSWLTGLFGTITTGQNIKTIGVQTLQLGTLYSYDKIPNTTRDFNIAGRKLTITHTGPLTVYINGVKRGSGNISGGTDIIEILYNETTIFIYTYYLSSKQTYTISYTQYPTVEIENSEELSIDITSDAPILNPSYSPPSTPIPPALPALLTIDPDNEKIGIVPAPDGNMQQIYEGTYEDYFKDYVENVTWDDLQNPTLPRTTIQEGTDSQGNPIIIINPSVNTPAFPNPNTDPEADTGVFQGTLIGLTQIVVNWLKLIWEAITSIPQAIYNLFVPEPGYFGGQVDILKVKLLGKFDNESAINFLDGLDNIQPKPIPDLYYKENIILEADFVNDMAPYIKSWLNFFLYVGIALASMNFFYKLIRGTNAIDIHAYDQKGSR